MIVAANQADANASVNLFEYMGGTMSISRCGEVEAILLVLMAQRRLRTLCSGPGVRDDAPKSEKKKAYVDLAHLIAWSSGVQEVIFGMIQGKGRCRF